MISLTVDQIDSFSTSKGKVAIISKKQFENKIKIGDSINVNGETLVVSDIEMNHRSDFLGNPSDIMGLLFENKLLTLPTNPYTVEYNVEYFEGYYNEIRGPDNFVVTIDRNYNIDFSTIVDRLNEQAARIQKLENR